MLPCGEMAVEPEPKHPESTVRVTCACGKARLWFHPCDMGKTAQIEKLMAYRHGEAA